MDHEALSYQLARAAQQKAIRARRRKQASSSARSATVAEPLLNRSEEHTSELQSLMRISYAVFCLKKKIQTLNTETAFSTTLSRKQSKNTSTHTKNSAINK